MLPRALAKLDPVVGVKAPQGTAATVAERPYGRKPAEASALSRTTSRIPKQPGRAGLVS